MEMLKAGPSAPRGTQVGRPGLWREKGIRVPDARGAFAALSERGGLRAPLAEFRIPRAHASEARFSLGDTLGRRRGPAGSPARAGLRRRESASTDAKCS